LKPEQGERLVGRRDGEPQPEDAQIACAVQRGARDSEAHGGAFAAPQREPA
jgi:hypothetical protein